MMPPNMGGIRHYPSFIHHPQHPSPAHHTLHHPSTPPHPTINHLHHTTHTRGGSRISHWGVPTLIGGGANLQHRCFLVKTYIKMKEFGPVGGAHRKPLYVDLPLHTTTHPSPTPPPTPTHREKVGP